MKIEYQEPYVKVRDYIRNESVCAISNEGYTSQDHTDDEFDEEDL